MKSGQPATALISSSSEPLIELVDVTKTYRSGELDVEVLHGVSLKIYAGEFLAIIGAAGLAVGLALHGSLSNFAAGVMMILFQPFRLGDHVEAGGAEGVVVEIQIFSTIIMTKDNKKVIVPNSKITGDKISVHLK